MRQVPQPGGFALTPSRHVHQFACAKARTRYVHSDAIFEGDAHANRYDGLRYDDRYAAAAVDSTSGAAYTPMTKSLKVSASQSRWSQRVMESSNALDLEPGVFTWDSPREIAESLRRSAERSERRKAEPFRSAMSMLTFYINRAGKQLPAKQRECLESAKDELRALFRRPRQRGRL